MQVTISKIQVKAKTGELLIAWGQEAGDGRFAKWQAQGAIHTPPGLAEALNVLALCAAKNLQYNREVGEQCFCTHIAFDYRKGIACNVQIAVPQKNKGVGACKSVKMREKQRKDKYGTVLEDASDDATMAAVNLVLGEAYKYVAEAKKAGAA